MLASLLEAARPGHRPADHAVPRGRRLLTLAALVTGTAAITLPGVAASQTGSDGSVPAIWRQRSASIDPTRLPLRDQHYVTSGPTPGYVYTCDARMFQQTNGPGARRVGPWINRAAGTYDVTRKPVVAGRVHHRDARFALTNAGPTRRITGNGLPVGVPTGVFPVAVSDPAYAYDPNPNAVTTQGLFFSIPRSPTVASAASCTYKEVGITLDGVAIHVPLDSSGRDELAYEIQDACTGSPQPGGAYHRHALSGCTPRIRQRAALVGYALDGFGIFSPYDEHGRELTSRDLDACHGRTSRVTWEGKTVTMYHYVMTRDFPYTVACFRGTPTRNAFPALPGAPPQH